MFGYSTKPFFNSGNDLFNVNGMEEKKNDNQIQQN